MPAQAKLLTASTPFPQISRWPLSEIKKTIFKSGMVTVVLDPGHGGKDSGAKGSKGLLEKDVVLSIAKKLRTRLKHEPGIRVILTRERDRFIPLRARLNLARRMKADIFIAIHADGYFDPRAKGASVYALSAHGATSEAARWLAQRDNYSELGGIELDNLKDTSLMVRSVLIDLAQTASIKDSLRLGQIILRSLDQVTHLHHKRVEQARFVVLKSPDVPSVLVEVGFISHPQEEKRLANLLYLNKITKALAMSIKQYVTKYP